MKEEFPNNAYHMPAYRKALEIFQISRAMASYFTHDRHVLEMDISSSSSHRFAGLLVTESLQLAPGVASALSTPSSELKLKRIRKIRKITRSLGLQCRNLEFSGVKEVEFLNMLRREIHHFEKLMSDWLLQIQDPSK